MSTLQRHLVAALGTSALLAVTMGVLVVIGNPEIEEPIGVLCWPIWCALWVIPVVTVFAAVSAAAEYVLVRRPGWRWFCHVPAMAVLFFLLGFLGCLTLSVFMGLSDVVSIPPAARVFGVPSMLFGLCYWLILRSARHARCRWLGRFTGNVGQ